MKDGKLLLLRHGVAFSFLAGFIFSTPSLADENTKDILNKAASFTVKIKRYTDFPFFDELRGSSFGSGFLVDRKRGWIATNAHVSGQNPASLEVAFRNRGYSDAKLVYVDPVLDMAVIEIEKNSIPEVATEASLACGSEPEIGTQVIAFGHPQKMEFSGSRGIISAKTTLLGTRWIQTDATTSGGSSGGPLLAADTGNVVGMSTRGIPKQNIKFAHFISPLCKILSQLRTGQDPSPHEFPYLIANDPDTQVGVNVIKVLSPAGSRLNLLVGDKIKGFIDRSEQTIPVATFYDLLEGLRGYEKNIRLSIERNAAKKTVAVQLKKHLPVLNRQGLYFSGVVVAALDRSGDQAINPDGYLVVHDVREGSVAHQSGIENYDRISRVDGNVIKDISDLCQHLRKKKDTNHKVRLILERTQNQKSGPYEGILIDIAVSELKQVGYTKTNSICK